MVIGLIHATHLLAKEAINRKKVRITVYHVIAVYSGHETVGCIVELACEHLKICNLNFDSIICDIGVPSFVHAYLSLVFVFVCSHSTRKCNFFRQLIFVTLLLTSVCQEVISLVCYSMFSYCVWLEPFTCTNIIFTVYSKLRVELFSAFL
jgi:hypothetical protein